MKKTRFFYGKKIFLAGMLVWLALLNEAVVMNTAQKREYVKQQEEKAAQQRAAGQAEKQQSKKGQEPDSLASLKAVEQAEPEAVDNPDIRVAIMDSGYTSYEHPYVSILQDGAEATYYPHSPELLSGPVRLEAGENALEVTSLERQEGSPSYRGSLEIKKGENGLLLINTLPLETYLESVVPSEMPSSYEPEALRAQAVCARTYAWKHLKEGEGLAFGADVDDSVNYQVYGNILPQESTTKAVRDTAGEVLRHNGELIEAYYFSTSAGITSTDEVWGASEPAGYLKSVECSFDAREPWSRWSTELPWSMLEERTAGLSGCSGALTGLEIVKKNESGVVTGLRVYTEAGSAAISGEYDVREFLSPQGVLITERNGSQTEGGVLLPSAYFSMEQEAGRSVRLEGGGYGHGVGMSQNAANQMAKEGYTYGEILNFFFREVTLETAGG